MALSVTAWWMVAVVVVSVSVVVTSNEVDACAVVWQLGFGQLRSRWGWLSAGTAVSKTCVRMSAILWLGGCRLRMWRRTGGDAVEPLLSTVLPPMKAEM